MPIHARATINLDKSDSKRSNEMDVVGTSVSVLTIVFLVIHLLELLGVSLSFMSVSDQETWEHDRVISRGYEKRRKQLIIHVVVTAVLMVACLIAAFRCWEIYTAPVNYDLAVIPEDPSDGLVVAAVGLVIVAFAGLFRLAILRAKLKAIRIVAAKKL